MKNLFFLPFPLHFSSGRVSGAGKGGNLRGGRRRKERGRPGFCELSKIGVVVGRTDGTGQNDARGRGREAPGKTVQEEEVSPEARKKKAKTGRKKKQKRVIILLQLHFSLGILVWKKLVAFEYFSPKLQRSFFLAKAI